MLRNTPIRRKLMVMLLLTSGAVLLLTCIAFIAYEYTNFRQSMLRNTATLAQVLATNSTAALAFDNQDDAREILTGLKAEPHTVAAALYDSDGMLFATYPGNLSDKEFPNAPEQDGFRFAGAYLLGWEPVILGGNKRLGTLYIKSDQRALYEQLASYSVIAATMTALAFLFAYLISRFLQRQISTPVLSLAQTAAVVSSHRDYSVRALKTGEDEFGQLTDAFNEMLTQIQERDREVRDSEARVRAVLNSALNAVIVMDVEGMVVDWNQRAEQIFGWTRQEALGRPLSELIIPPALRHAHYQGVRRFLLTGHGRILDKLIELTAVHRDGHEFPVEVSINALQTGNVTRFCGFITDITERKQNQARIQAQLNRLDLLQRITRAIGERLDLSSIFQVVIRSLEDNLPVDFGCICLYDTAAHSLTVTRVGVKSRQLALDLALTEQSHIPIDENGLSRCVRGYLVYEPDIGEVPAAFPKRLHAGGLRSMVAAPLLAESKVFGVLVAARRAPNGFSSNDCEFLRQLSEHVGLAAHQAQLYAALQDAYDELRQSQQTIMQQERLRALGQMASGVAHDINNAISPVSLYTESLLEREPGLSERARTYLTTIQRAIEDVAQTVSRMREFYRPREIQLNLARVDLNKLAQQVIDLTRVRWRDLPQERGLVIDLRSEFAAELPAIMGAENEIRDALTNLVFNAVDAMPEGGALTLRTRVLPPAYGGERSVPTVALEVIDTGIGMDEETRRHCLEPFYTTKGERGTGLGLAMVYGMVQRHSADLQIESAPGKGTTMRLLFTAALLDPAETARQMVFKPQRRLRLLIVDDDPLIIESLRDILQRDGHAVTTADGGQAGIDAFLAARAAQPFDAVITDLGMPYVDGRRVAAAVKGASDSTPVILLTGWGQRLLDENDVPAHVDRVLNKPPKLAELRLALAELISSANSVPSS